VTVSDSPPRASRPSRRGSEGRAGRAAAKQSGIRNIQWDDAKRGWKVRFRDPVSLKLTERRFAVSKFADERGSSDVAVSGALRAASNFRSELVARGVLQEDEAAEPQLATLAYSPPPQPPSPPPVRRRRSNAGGVRGTASKQSGIRNIQWDDVKRCWMVRFRDPASGKQRSRAFPVHAHMINGCGVEEAVAAALRAAIPFRTQLVEQGILPEADTELCKKLMR